MATNVNLQQFIINLRSLLESHGQSAFELSGAVHASPSTISRYLAGTRVPDIEVAVSIANYYNVSLDWLLGISERMRDKYSPNVKRFAELYSIATDVTRLIRLDQHKNASE